MPGVFSADGRQGALDLACMGCTQETPAPLHPGALPSGLSVRDRTRCLDKVIQDKHR